jgi:hypothetical protein
MFTFIILLALFIVVDLAALRWGVDSTDTLASCEWERRWHTQDATEDQLLSC